ncbi:MAG: FAD-dependent oxidoreductase [Gammaproteobacteria bacterium]|nr:FAD-dependent oxidoreductase [Gammaproteobacteria bacterium]MBU0787674.1 FAD-dependent oxidoreductase [Gammaproteobacteria bacterium]MBU0814856.1 FAD-dependent oxidoreductase [Gammaproteobacteria bacterium]MBU1786036.1 FAD-dependent oxidoreductase [Gammaproteobacteria bacterium]
MTEVTDLPDLSKKQLLLIGTGPSHLHVLASLARNPHSGVQVTLVAPHTEYFVAAMVPGFVAGQHTLERCMIPLAPLVQKADVHWRQQRVCALDADKQRVTLDDGSELAFDWLSVNTEPVQDRERLNDDMPGALDNALFVRPIEGFAKLWPRVTELAQSRALRVAVVGSGTAAIELAMAIRHRLGQSAVTLITGGAVLASHYPPGMQKRVLDTLKARNITVLKDKAVGIAAGEMHLGQGARLACDIQIIANGTQLPAWMATSGLAMDAHGLIAIDGCQRSVSHPALFASAGAHGAASLSRNLLAVMSGQPPQAIPSSRPRLQMLSCGNRQAIAAWGNYSVQGYSVWLWKIIIRWFWLRRYRSI